MRFKRTFVLLLVGSYLLFPWEVFATSGLGCGSWQITTMMLVRVFLSLAFFGGLILMISCGIWDLVRSGRPRTKGRGRLFIVAALMIVLGPLLHFPVAILLEKAQAACDNSKGEQREQIQMLWN